MLLFINRIEWISLQQLFLQLKLMDEHTASEVKKELGAIGIEYVIDSDKETFSGTFGAQALNRLQLKNQLFATYLQEISSSGISERTENNDSMLAVSAICEWIRIFSLKKMIVRAHQIPFAYIDHHVDIRDLTVEFVQGYEETPENGQALENMKWMLLLLRTLLKHEYLDYTNKFELRSTKVLKQHKIYSDMKQEFISIILLDDGDEYSIRSIPVGSGIAHDVEHIDPEMVILQCNIDDINPEIIPYVVERLFAAGANDVYYHPIVMKKGRLGTMINVLCQQAVLAKMENIIFEQTSTLGIRKMNASVHRLQRSFRKIDTPWGKVSVKIGQHEGEVTQISPEFEDCRKIAKEQGIPLKTVYDWVKSQTMK